MHVQLESLTTQSKKYTLHYDTTLCYIATNTCTGRHYLTTYCLSQVLADCMGMQYIIAVIHIYQSYTCTYIHDSHILSIHINIPYSTATLPNTTCYTATHTQAYTLVLYQTLTSIFALIDSRPPLSRIRRIASKDPEEAALCSGVSPLYYDILYIQIA